MYLGISYRPAVSAGGADYDTDSSFEEDYSGGHPMSSQYQIEISLDLSSTSDLVENPDNQPLFETLRESYGLLQRKYYPMAIQYVRLLDRVLPSLSSSCDQSSCRDLKGRLTRIMGAMEGAMDKAKQIGVLTHSDGRRSSSGKKKGKGILKPDLLDLQEVLRGTEGKTRS